MPISDFKRPIDHSQPCPPAVVMPGRAAATSAPMEHSPSEELLVLAAALEFQVTLDQSDSLQSAALRTVALLCQALPAGRAVLLWRTTNKTDLRMIADSDGSDLSGDRHQQRCLIAAGEEVAVRRSLAVWPIPDHGGQDPAGRHALLAVAQLAKLLQARRVAGVDLVTVDGQSRGTLLVIDFTDSAADRFLTAVATPLAGKLDALERLQPTPIESLWRSISGRLANRFRLAIGLLLFAALAMLVPLRHRIAAELELRPVGRRFVAVPFDGTLKSAFRRAGDIVHAGDVIAIIDPREIDYELAGIHMALNQAEQDKKGRMAAHQFAATKIADLESERLRLQRDLLEHRRENLQIRSPIDGVIVSGDWQQSEGMPMRQGETLFEIAPLGRMIVEVEVDESDIAHVRNGMPVSFYLDAFPDRRLTGLVSRIHLRALQRNHNSVFVSEVLVDDSDGVLRAGMRGHASITSDRHPLGWILFHKAYFALRQTLGW